MAELDRRALLALLGHDKGFADSPEPVAVESREALPGFRQVSLRLSAGSRRLPALLLTPDGPPSDKGFPSILYCHAHGNRYDIGKSELVDGRPALLDPPLGPVLARAGFAVLCVDMPGFGARQAEGSEQALAKTALWRGRSLLGDMLRDQSIAFRALAALPEVDPARIGTFGISMGGTLAYFLAALMPEIRCAAHLCVFANLAPLADEGGLDLHGIYMVVPGLLKAHDAADVAAMIAPRPLLVCAGLEDPLTPPSALWPALDRLRVGYRQQAAQDALRILTDDSAGHEETPAFRAAVLDFFSEHLVP
ncbi:S9 family peptidase [Tropicimonas sp. IMCC6043]|uniref:alpha/beta hydrolase family protein n=1 Tax=Tropicimonas sp. IMCC6043 TaxID=2510645 RepID=UPI00101CC8BA|nr:acetylxylan esterase [Tropicimonas sp. IMCC6043]RYH11611.1 hypothetical protein EU800_02945 [Tropicimonas sp. IMCC6043]